MTSHSDIPAPTASEDGSVLIEQWIVKVRCGVCRSRSWMSTGSGRADLLGFMSAERVIGKDKAEAAADDAWLRFEPFRDDAWLRFEPFRRAPGSANAVDRGRAAGALLDKADEGFTHVSDLGPVQSTFGGYAIKARLEVKCRKGHVLRVARNTLLKLLNGLSRSDDSIYLPGG